MWCQALAEVFRLSSRGPIAFACAMSSPRWPEDWEARKAGVDCPMCATVQGQPYAGWVGVLRGRYADVNLERRTPLAGYCIVAWNGRHVAEPTELSPAEAGGYWAEVLAVGRAIETVFRPVKINYQLLGNLLPHLHTHVMPRYSDDPAPGRPISWEVIFGADPVDDQVLQRQAADLRSALAAN